MKNLHQLKEERAIILEKMEAMNDKAQAEQRTLSKEEKTEWEKCTREISLLDPKIAEAKAREDAAIQAVTEGRGITHSADGSFSSYNSQPATEWRDTRTGQPVHVLKRNQRFTDTLQPQERNLSLGKAIRSMIISDWRDAEQEQRALSSATGSAGVAVPKVLMAGILDQARAKSVLMRAGAQSLMMESNNAVIAKITEDPAMQWKAENDKFNIANVGFDGINLVTHTLGTIVTMSRELAADAPNAVQAIESAMAGALAAEIDRVGLFGDGINKPTGIGFYPGVQEIASVGSVVDYNALVQAWVKVLQENGQPNAYAITPQLAGELEQLVAGADGQYLKAPTSIANLERFISSTLPTNLGAGTNESLAFLGDFTKVLFGIRQGMMLEVSNFSGEAFERHQVQIKLTWRGDVALTNPAHMVKLTGIIPFAA